MVRRTLEFSRAVPSLHVCTSGGRQTLLFIHEVYHGVRVPLESFVISSQTEPRHSLSFFCQPLAYSGNNTSRSFFFPWLSLLPYSGTLHASADLLSSSVARQLSCSINRLLSYPIICLLSYSATHLFPLLVLFFSPTSHSPAQPDGIHCFSRTE